MKIALANGALGEKMMVDSIFNCLVNDQGSIFIHILSGRLRTAALRISRHTYFFQFLGGGTLLSLDLSPKGVSNL